MKLLIVAAFTALLATPAVAQTSADQQKHEHAPGAAAEKTAHPTDRPDGGHSSGMMAGKTSEMMEMKCCCCEKDASAKRMPSPDQAKPPANPDPKDPHSGH